MSSIEVIDGKIINKNLKFIGYGFQASKKDIKNIDKKNTKAYKALRKLFLDDIIIEISTNEKNNRNELQKLIDANVLKDDASKPIYNQDVAIVIPNIETLGNTVEEVFENYFKIFNYLNIVILNRSDLSTCSLDGEMHYDFLDSEDKYRYTETLSWSSSSTRGQAILQMTKNFRKVFWEWQNYFIDTKQACELLDCSHSSLYKLSQEFMTKAHFRTVYEKEFGIRDYIDKPIRGITLDDDTSKVLIFLQRKLGDEWDENKIFWMCHEDSEFINMNKSYFYIDYIRLRLNYMYGHSKVIEASKKYKKDDEYFNKLKSEIEKL